MNENKTADRTEQTREAPPLRKPRATHAVINGVVVFRDRFSEIQNRDARED